MSNENLAQSPSKKYGLNEPPKTSRPDKSPSGQKPNEVSENLNKIEEKNYYYRIGYCRGYKEGLYKGLEIYVEETAKNSIPKIKVKSGEIKWTQAKNT